MYRRASGSTSSMGTPLILHRPTPFLTKATATAVFYTNSIGYRGGAGRCRAPQEMTDVIRATHARPSVGGHDSKRRRVCDSCRRIPYGRMSVLSQGSAAPAVSERNGGESQNKPVAGPVARPAVHQMAHRQRRCMKADSGARVRVAGRRGGG